MKKKAMAAVCCIALGLLCAACQGEGAATAPAQAKAPTPENRTLIVYFSLGNNAPYGTDVDASTSASLVRDGSELIGTTEYVARMIQSEVGGDLHSLQVRDLYSTDFREVIDRNHEEIREGTLPALVGDPIDVSSYSTVFIGYPVWAAHAPQAIFTFLSEHDLAGKTIIPFCTHDGYGAGDSYGAIVQAVEGEKAALPGLALDAEDVPGAERRVAEWLSRIGLPPADQGEGTAIQVQMAGKTVSGVLYDTPLAGEIRSHFPVTVTMSGWGGREYYGPLGFTPEQVPQGQRHFQNGDITYCRQNNAIAIFYDQTDRPNLTMEVVPIGRITSDLQVFHELPQQVDMTFSL